MNIRNKLKRSVQWLGQFQKMAQEVKAERTMLEADAQSSFLTALLKIEYEDYTKALEELLKSKAILKGLRDTVGSIQKAHIEEKLEQINNNIRFCKFQLNEYSGKDKEILEMQRVMMEDPTLAIKLEVWIFFEILKIWFF